MTSMSSTLPDAVPTTPMSARAAGTRIGMLFGPSIFGVTAAGVALPDVAGGLDASPTAVVWVLTAHALALGLGVAVFGGLSDIGGARRTMLAGAGLLTAGALACVTAPDLGVLVAGRFVQAAGSGATAAAALALVAATAPDHRPTVLAWFGGAMAGFSAAATLTGGVVADLVSWRVVLILPALAALAVPFCLPLARRSPDRAPFDPGGAALLAVAAAGLLVTVQAPTVGLDVAATIPAVLAAGAALVALVRHVRRNPFGFVPRTLIGDRAFVRSAAVGAGVYGGLFGVVYAVPRLLTQEHAWTVLAIGAWLLPGAIVGAVASRLAGRLRVEAGHRLVLGVSTAFGLALIAAGRADAPAVAIVATSMGMTAFATTQVVITASVSPGPEPARRGSLLGLLNLAFFLGGGVGAAVVGTVADASGMPAALCVLAAFPIAAGLLSVRRTRRSP